VTFQPGLWLLTSFSSTQATRLEGLNPQAADNLPYHILHIKKQKALSPKQDPASLNDDIGGLAQLLNFGRKMVETVSQLTAKAWGLCLLTSDGGYLRCNIHRCEKSASRRRLHDNVESFCSKVKNHRI
jgi:hypothetical protein